jgi:hypothetical protein
MGVGEGEHQNTTKGNKGAESLADEDGHPH